MAGVSLTSHDGYHVDDAIYFNHPTECWIRGTLTRIIRATKKDGTAHVLYGCSAVESDRYLPSLSQNPSLVHVYPLQQHDIHRIIESCVEVTEETTLNDLLELSYLHDATLLEQVRARYYENLIYTHIGPITIALNPYDFTLPNYTDNNMPKYLLEGSNAIETSSKNLPHAWTVGHYSYWRMCLDKRNQSIIVSGESGAGKTETAKIVAKYIGVVSTMQCSLQEKSGAEELTHKVNLTSPILEAFGNAKTKNNDNSSRFGKFMKFFFKHSLTGGVMTGALITVYLLERSRIVTHSKGERGYHSFYQLLAGNDDAAKSSRLNQLQLARAADYRCTAIGNAMTIDGVNDADDFDNVMSAMKFVGMTEAECNAVWSTVGAVLHLLSLEFKALTDDECYVDMAAQNAAIHVRMVKELLGLPNDFFFQELVTTTQLTRGETIVRKLRLAQALDLCEGIAKLLYEALFLWLVGRINELIKPPSDDEGQEMLWIGLLDIFGFENFPYGNSFEQLCINLANEALQNHYNNIIFTRDIEECHKEGINTESVVIYDNQPCVDLICGVDFSGCGPGGSSRTTNKMSILHLLDEESTLAKGSDLAFREKICDTYGGRLLDGKGGHPNFLRAKTDRSSFVINHYAGKVTYNVEGFRTKNCDATKETLKDAIRCSTIPLVASLLGRKVSDSGLAGKATVSSFFKGQLVQLMTEINGTHPHWIRCIKPHSSKKPRMFNGSEVMSQMRSAGVLETIKIRQNSFSVRIPFAEFLRTHRVLTLKLHSSVFAFCRSFNIDLTGFQGPFSANSSEKEMVREILRRAGTASNSQGQVGLTKVFLRMETSQHLSSIVRTVQKGCALMIQAAARCTLSCGAVNIKYLRHKLQIIAAALSLRSSQLRMRQIELHGREKYLLTALREILLLQNVETERRVCLEEEERTARLRLLDGAKKGIDSINHLLLKRKEEQDVAMQCALINMEEGARCALEDNNDASRQCLYAAMELLALEENVRDDLELEEAMERTSTLGPLHRKMNTYLALWFVHVVEKQQFDLLEAENAYRCRTAEEESIAFTMLCTLDSFLLSEIMARVSLLDEESDAFSGCRQGWDFEWLRVEKIWLTRKSITNRRAVLLLQKNEIETRRNVEHLYNDSAMELLKAFAQGKQLALEGEKERLALEEEEQRLLEEEALFMVNEEERRRFNAIREAAQHLWHNMMEEEQLVGEIKRVEEKNQCIIACKAQLTREYTLLCRRKEIARGRSSLMTDKIGDMKELEEYQHQQRTLSQTLATNQKLLLDMEKNLTEFRSRTSLKSRLQRTPSLIRSTGSPKAQEGVLPHAPPHISVSGEGSLHLIHRMHLMKGVANSRARECSTTPGALAAANRLKVYRKSRERRKCEALETLITKRNAMQPRNHCELQGMFTCLTSEQCASPTDYCLQRNPFKDDWVPGPPDAEGIYWVFTPHGERVPLLSVERCNPSGAWDTDVNECGYTDSPDPSLPCFNR
ncbi:putative myosin heavy chain [Trypanosoma rangeli]|uniref:Putative myosin heavy chain n=1 Tax=Trypanosoma rangeli TaxID=5698 RepID=A0A422NAD7_TRYRA|nr:putative myosin heavy chain [Trypanosoma rangeli]RNF02425.1 putative myosin heavy chain [Trypanosoma rangeli]|eukprot:RNF02425.1 putative myosin heavy chain [Trypanosoma rangeli]